MADDAASVAAAPEAPRPAGGADTSAVHVQHEQNDAHQTTTSVGQHPANAGDYDVDVQERVQKRVVHGEERDSSGDEYETQTTITRTTKTTTYTEKPRPAPAAAAAPRHRQQQPAPPPAETFFHSEDMSANKKLYGKDLSVYENMDLDDLLDQLTPEEVDLLTRDVDPDDTLMPPCQRLSYRCDKKPTGPLDRKKLIEHIHQQALNEPDRPEMVPYEPNTVRGKKWIPPPPPLQEQKLEEEIALDMGDEYETALGDASEGELVDLAAILGFHSMMNQEQYHASLLGKRLQSDVGWAGITRASRPKPMTPEPPNDTDPEQSIARLGDDDPQLQQLNLNNIKTMSDEQLERLCAAAATNTQLESLLLSNTGLSDRHAQHLVTMLERNRGLRELSLESNFISPAMVARLVKALLKNKTLEALRAANQRSAVLGNKVEMEITKYVEENPVILQLGVHFEFNDSRARVAAQLQKNRDRLRVQRNTEGMSCSVSIRLPASKVLPASDEAAAAAAEDTDDDEVADIVDTELPPVAAAAEHRVPDPPPPPPPPPAGADAASSPPAQQPPLPALDESGSPAEVETPTAGADEPASPTLRQPQERISIHRKFAPPQHEPQ